jgi:ABC-type proline/glycine betaine transport system permease subunit
LSVGIFLPDGSWLFPVAHGISTIMEAFFCTGSVVLSYQLCLRWFGRERLDGLMTTAQIAMAVTFVIGGQILPRVLFRLTATGGGLAALPLWVGLLPPAWFAGFDDAIAGSGGMGSWVLAALAVMVTAIVLWLAVSKLARDYETGLQALGETVSTKARSPGRRWIDVLISVPPFRWWLREPVSRASFLLAAAYLVRDRDTKLRLYPSLAPMLILPFVFLIDGQSHSGNHFMIALSVGYAGAIIATMPLQGLLILQYSQQWQAADIFHVAPMRGPAELSHGARRAVLCFLTFPLLALFGLIFGLLLSDPSQLLLLLPSLIAMPVFALVPCLGDGAVPLSRPTEEAKSASRGMSMVGIMFLSLFLSAVSALAWHFGFFWWLVLVETVLALAIYRTLKRSIAAIRWKSLE